MIIKHGGIDVTTWINSICRDEAHPIVRNLLAGAVRAALLAKINPLTGAVKGRRPLGMTEKWRCLIWACVNVAMKRRLRCDVMSNVMCRCVMCVT